MIPTLSSQWFKAILIKGLLGGSWAMFMLRFVGDSLFDNGIPVHCMHAMHSGDPRWIWVTRCPYVDEDSADE
ncbi:hypothetical protein BJ878DRAFT_500616 [Calycina marina]|uniref:Uncharacterized protein n=1 Tax=Calycina marina TaxID=1763456 RepID=A0A9P7Z5E8_9HELO|nr:hypothetical protein BJ878DRAFT_500616 [Calycina marina]